LYWVDFVVAKTFLFGSTIDCFFKAYSTGAELQKAHFYEVMVSFVIAKTFQAV
jgi:hypothetical protein